MNHPNLQSADSLKSSNSSFASTSDLDPDELLYGAEPTVVMKRIDINPPLFSQ